MAGNSIQDLIWSLGFDVTIVDIDSTIQEVKVNDITLSGILLKEELSVDIDYDRVNVMDLDVNVVVDGINSSIVESQVVTYDRIKEINDLSPESTYEKGFASSAKAAKELHNLIAALGLKYDVLKSDVDKLEEAIENIEINPSGPSDPDTPVIGDSHWVLGADGLLHSKYGIYVKGDAIFEGDTSSTGEGNDNPSAGGASKLKELNDVSLSSLAEGDVLVYDKDTDKWYNTPQSSIVPKLDDYAKKAWVSENFVSDAAITEVINLISSMWKIEGNEVVADMDVRIRGNLIVSGDTSSEGEGQDTPSSGIDEQQLQEYLDENKYVKEEYVNTKIAEIDLSGFATKSDVQSLSEEVETIYETLGLSETAEGYINTWNEVVAFLDGFDKDNPDLAVILQGMDAEIAKKVDNDTFNTLSAQVATNKTNIGKLDTRLKTAEGEIDTLQTYTTWLDSVKGLIYKDGDNIKINTSLIVSGDTSSEGSGSDTPALGTVTSIKVNNTPYNPNSAGVIDLSEAFNSIDVSDQLANYALTDYVNSQFALVNSALSGKQDALGYTPLSTSGGTISGKLRIDNTTGENGYALMVNNGDIATNNYLRILAWPHYGEGNAHAWYDGTTQTLIWGGATTMTLSGNTLLHSGNYSDYALPLSGGTITSAKEDALQIYRKDGAVGIKMIVGTENGWVGFSPTDYGTYIYTMGYYLNVTTAGKAYFDNKELIHSGNIGSYAVLAGKWYDNGVEPARNSTGILNGVGAFINVGYNSDYWFRFYVDGDGLQFSSNRSGTKLTGKTIAFTDSDITGNAAGLKHSTGIVGASVDRSGNVIAAKSILNSNDNWYLGSISSALGCTDEGAMLYSYQKPLYLGNSSKVRMLINSSGNVTFGSSDLAVTTYKMSVDGKVHIRSTAGASMNEGAGGLIVGNGTVLMIDANDIQAKTDGTTAGPLYINDWGGNVILCGQNKGNVLIGKTDDDGSGAKLQVNGVIKNNNYVITSNGVFVGSSYSDRLTNGLYAGNLMSSALTSADLYLYSSSKLYMYGGGGITMASAVTMSSTLSVATSVTTPLLKSSGGLDIVANNSGAGSKLFLTTNCFRPWGDDAKLIDLGASTVQWRNVYAVNGIFSGDTSSGSDIRFKDIIDHKTIKIEDIANAPLFTFTWNDREDKTPHLGTSAQYWENVCSELVSGSDFKTLNYASLGVAMGISLAKKAVNHEERIKVLEKENKALKEEIRRMQYGS